MKEKVWILNLDKLSEEDAHLDLDYLSDEEFIKLCEKYNCNCQGIYEFAWDFNHECVPYYSAWIRIV